MSTGELRSGGPFASQELHRGVLRELMINHSSQPCYPVIMVEEDVSTGRNCISTNISTGSLGICCALFDSDFRRVKLARRRMTASSFDAITETWCALEKKRGLER